MIVLTDSPGLEVDQHGHLERSGLGLSREREWRENVGTHGECQLEKLGHRSRFSSIDKRSWRKKRDLTLRDSSRCECS